jgi:hypothetical protein
MFALKLKAQVDANRMLVIELPPDTPLGEVELTILSTAHSTVETSHSERQQVRARLDAAGLLVHHPVPVGITPLTPDERLRIGTLKSGAKSSLELIDEDRGKW